MVRSRSKQGSGEGPSEESAKLILWKPTTIGNRGIFIGCNKFVRTDEFNSKYIHHYHKPRNIGYIHRFGLDTDEYIGSQG
jgi:hypothetical protein